MVAKISGSAMKRLLTILFIPALLLFGGPSEGYAFDEASLKKLRAMNQCEKCDLQEANLWMANLSQANLSQADLEKANLKRAKLSEAKLSGANLTDVDLTNTVLGKLFFQNKHTTIQGLSITWLT